MATLSNQYNATMLSKELQQLATEVKNSKLLYIDEYFYIGLVTIRRHESVEHHTICYQDGVEIPLKQFNELTKFTLPSRTIDTYELGKLKLTGYRLTGVTINNFSFTKGEK